MTFIQLLQEHDTIKKVEVYMVELPNINTKIHVVCTFIGACASDMEIIYDERNNEKITKYNNSSISCRYEWQYKSIHFTSFSYRNKCSIYRIILEQ
jgi:hypothetical protein